MEAYQERIIKEKKDLDDRIDRLYLFMQTKSYLVLDYEDRWFLSRQHIIMQQYSEILGKRIERFK